jgi:hypothetical protein
MSRHYLTCLDPRYFTVVGWDPPTSTFFAQVIDREKLILSERYKPAAEVKFDYRSVTLWRGVERGEIQEVNDIGPAIAGYVTLPEELKQTLIAEQAARRQPSPLQQDLVDRLSKVGYEK